MRLVQGRFEARKGAGLSALLLRTGESDAEIVHKKA